jgi:hypothetical protein
MERELTELEGRKIAALVMGMANEANEMMRRMLLRGEPLTEDLVISTVGTTLTFQVAHRAYLDADVRVYDVANAHERQERRPDGK